MKNKDFLTDYSAYILLKGLGPLIRLLPLPIGFFIGRMLGDVFYLVDLKHRAIVYANIKTALGGSMSQRGLRQAVRRFYRSFSQNIIEIFYIPKFDKIFLDRHASIEGRQNISEGFQRGKGVIFVAMHAGSWELANIISANLGFAFSLFVREQNFPRIEKLLNAYRGQHGCRFIQRENELRELLRVLKANESVAMTIDQGGKTGTTVKFFGKYASMSSGAVRLALKLDCALIPVFPVREKGGRIKFWVEPVFKLKSTGNLEADVRDNLQSLVQIFEKYIARYPHEYLWSYKVWKYSTEKNILILSDAKTGHLRQSQALAKLVVEHLKAKGITVQIDTAEVVFKSALASRWLTLANCLSGKYICQGCLFCLRSFLDRENYYRLVRTKPDIIISCGSSLVPVNYLLSRENQARSLVIMRPSIFSARRFDLVVMASHDRPIRRKNIAVIDGALNLIEPEYLKSQVRQLTQETGVSFPAEQSGLGLLLGGDTKDFRLLAPEVKEVISQLKEVSISFNAWILATTSRRTPPNIDRLVKKELAGFERSKLAVIANENNLSSVVGGILGLSRIVVVSGESISMVSEAASSSKQVVVFKSPGLSARRMLFLENLARKGVINLVEAGDIGKTIERLLSSPPEIRVLRDNQIILESLRRIF